MPRPTSRIFAIASLTLGVAAFATPALASSPEDATEGWRLDLAPYLWIPAIEGESTIDGQTAEVDVSPGDVLDLVGDGLSLVSGFLHGEARKDRFFLLLDLALTRLDTDGSAELPVARPNVSISVDASLRQDSIVAELGGGYTLWKAGLPDYAQFLLEGVIGVRYHYYWTQAEVDARARASLPGGPIRRSVALRTTDTSQWADPFIGARWQLPICQNLFLHFRGDVGGFGLASDFAWSLNGFFSWELPWRPFGGVPSMRVGYRALSFDYDGGDDGQDLLMHGAAVGLAVAL